MKSFAVISTAILMLGAPALAAQPAARDEFLLDPFNPTAYVIHHVSLATHHAPKSKPKVTHPETETVVTPPALKEAAAAVTLPAPTPAVIATPSVPEAPASPRFVAAPSAGPYATVTAGTPHAPAAPLLVVAPPASTNDATVTVTPPNVSLGTIAFLAGGSIQPTGRPIVIVPFRPPVISAFRP